MKGKNKRDKWVHLRVSQGEYDRLHARFKNTTCRKLSEFIRDILLKRPVAVYYRNKSADEFLPVAIQLKNELNSIGVNINQVVKRINAFRDYEELCALLFRLQFEQEVLSRKVDIIKSKMYEIYQLLLAEADAKKPREMGPVLPDIDQAAAADDQENISGQ